MFPVDFCFVAVLFARKNEADSQVYLVRFQTKPHKALFCVLIGCMYCVLQVNFSRQCTNVSSLVVDLYQCLAVGLSRHHRDVSGGHMAKLEAMQNTLLQESLGGPL